MGSLLMTPVVFHLDGVVKIKRFLFFGIVLPFYVFDSIILGIFRILASISDSNLLQDQLFPKDIIISKCYKNTFYHFKFLPDYVCPRTV